MGGNDTLFVVLFGATAIIGIVGTIAYYFARYGVRGTDEVPPPETALPEKALPEKSLSEALAPTRASLWGRVKSLFGDAAIDPSLREPIEEILYTSDLGVATVERLMAAIETDLSGRASAEEFRQHLKTKMQEILQSVPEQSATSVNATPEVWLIVGVNGVGKTTTIGKLAYQQAALNRKVMVAAGDTFRAAADAQLKAWSERAAVEIFSPEGVQDPAAIAFQAVEQARSKGMDLVIIDTAGRLHTQKNLMEELKKVKRVLQKQEASAPHHTWLVLDANSGQNALVQAREFHQALELDGVILTKMDGTAKGGVALGLAVELGLRPVMIGVGEKLSDLRPFEVKEYVDAII